MAKVRQTSSDKLIFLVRRVFYNTPVMRWKLTAYIYDRVFSFGMPDLSKPIPFRNMNFFVDPKDRSYVPSMVGGYYEKHELDIFEDISKVSTTMFDIGANIGMYSILAVNHNPSIKCWAFEPVKENQKILEKNISLNKTQKNITVVKSAVSDKTGTALIHLSDKQSGTHSLSVDRGGASRKVPTVGVDSYCKKYKLAPDLIKIDVEGHEASVFNGMKNILKTKPTIFMEYIPELNQDMHDLILHLADIYKYCFVVDTVHSKVSKIALKDIDQSKMYNIILSANKAHLRKIKPYITNQKEI